MTKTHNDQISRDGRLARFPGQAAAALRFTLHFPFKLAGRILGHFVQALFAVFIVILHPQAKWLFNLIAKSSLVRNYIRPSLQTFVVSVYDPYFAFLGRLSPYWATFSIAVPLAILEPAKFVATIMIAERPKAGAVLWLALQGLSLILIDRTWAAVRPKSRKIRLVALIHAWGWLNVEYGKYWMRNSSFYRIAMVWKRQARRSARDLWMGLAPRRHRTR